MASGESNDDGSVGGTSSAKEKLATFRKFASVSYTRARQVSLLDIVKSLFKIYLKFRRCTLSASLCLFARSSMLRSDWVRLN